MYSWIKNAIKAIPGAVKVYESVLGYRLSVRVTFLAMRTLRVHIKPHFRFKGMNPKDTLVAITVSTNYSDLLRICLDANQTCFDHWIFITQETDKRTRDLLANAPNATVLFWNPNKGGAIFDKGTALRNGQIHAYKKFPNSWYVVIDSDIVLEGDLEKFRQELTKLDPSGIYGIERKGYANLEDLKAKANYRNYKGNEPLHGYFQLYSTPHLYRGSKDASVTDLEFLNLFRKKHVLQNPSCAHLGQVSHWKGRDVNSGDFLQ